MSWFGRLTSSPTTDAVELTARFAEARQRVLAENVANIDTPDYHTKRLDAASFEASLREALDRAQAAPDEPLELRGNAQFSTGPDGTMSVRPAVEPAPNILFHDGTNARLEQLLTETAENSQDYELALNLLRTRFDLLLRAIRGRS